MRLMHTRLPDFYTKVGEAAHKLRKDVEYEIRGLENFKTAKLASLRVGRVEDEIVEITQDENIKKVEVALVPLNPESSYTVVIKGIQEDGSCNKAILETMFLSAPTEECELFGVKEIIDRRGAGITQKVRENK